MRGPSAKLQRMSDSLRSYLMDFSLFGEYCRSRRFLHDGLCPHARQERVQAISCRHPVTWKQIIGKVQNLPTPGWVLCLRSLLPHLCTTFCYCARPRTLKPKRLNTCCPISPGISCSCARSYTSDSGNKCMSFRCMQVRSRL